jgi:hypothetical protein
MEDTDCLKVLLGCEVHFCTLYGESITSISCPTWVRAPKRRQIASALLPVSLNIPRLLFDTVRRGMPMILYSLMHVQSYSTIDITQPS